MGKFKNLFEMRSRKQEKMVELRSKAQRNVSIYDFYLTMDYNDALRWTWAYPIEIKKDEYLLSDLNRTIKEFESYINEWKKKAEEINPVKIQKYSSMKYDKLINKYQKERLDYIKHNLKEISPYEHFEIMFNEANKKIKYFENFIKLLLKIQKRYNEALKYKDEYD